VYGYVLQERVTESFYCDWVPRPPANSMPRC